MDAPISPCTPSFSGLPLAAPPPTPFATNFPPSAPLPSPPSAKDLAAELAALAMDVAPSPWARARGLGRRLKLKLTATMPGHAPFAAGRRGALVPSAFSSTTSSTSSSISTSPTHSTSTTFASASRKHPTTNFPVHASSSSFAHLSSSSDDDDDDAPPSEVYPGLFLTHLSPASPSPFPSTLFWPHPTNVFGAWHCLDFARVVCIGGGDAGAVRESTRDGVRHLWLGIHPLDGAREEGDSGELQVRLSHAQLVAAGQFIEDAYTVAEGDHSDADAEMRPVLITCALGGEADAAALAVCFRAYWEGESAYEACAVLDGDARVGGVWRGCLGWRDVEDLTLTMLSSLKFSTLVVCLVLGLSVFSVFAAATPVPDCGCNDDSGASGMSAGPNEGGIGNGGGDAGSSATSAAASTNSDTGDERCKPGQTFECCNKPTPVFGLLMCEPNPDNKGCGDKMPSCCSRKTSPSGVEMIDCNSL
ncbi:hypothetical protein FA95DRAFT_1609742 [Auriscalpium vulgare]|uniref:Uncharacterized protein n=1 Tax=Auriscalpium vulgare TaxID=40419 RepID=A0ACB8RFY1_9AGAM|nr:hypothetical protein FA95DRAFT_1609742 [Auriscalpium vulgare]